VSRTLLIRLLGAGVTLLLACDDGRPEPLTASAVYPLSGVGDPSGADFFAGRVYVVGDARSRVYAFSPEGVGLGTMTLDDGPKSPDIEGVAVEADGYLLADEGKGAIYRSGGRERIRLSGAKDGNNGLEGLTLRRSDGHLFAVKEKRPSLLYHLGPDGREIQRTRLEIADDVSGVAHLGRDECPEQLLAVSQESRELVQFTTAGVVLRRWALEAKRPEGLAFDGAGTLFVVDEARAELSVIPFEGACL